MTRELLFLSPYRFPAQNTLYLGNEDVYCLLNGYLALWHPAALLEAATPPRIASPYDHEQPVEGHIYGVPESPALVLPDDWEQRVLSANALMYRAVTERPTTLSNLLTALRLQSTEPRLTALLDLPADRVAPFLGLGFGYAQVEALFEAMEHQYAVDIEAFQQEVQQAVALVTDPDPEAFRVPLRKAAERLLAAREILYPTSLWLLDLHPLNDKALEQPFSPAITEGLATVNLIVSAGVLTQMAERQPERLELIKQRIAEEKLDVCGGIHTEREDALLPLESQLWNLRTGKTETARLLGKEVRVFARRSFAYHPQLPSQLYAAGLQKMLLLNSDDGVLPSHRSVTISWPAHDGKQVDALTRTPHATDSPQVFFHAAHHLHQTIMQDQTATLLLIHNQPACPYYRDWLELSRLAPVLGKWSTLSRYFDEIYAGDYTSPASADEFHGDALGQRVPQEPEPTYDDIGNEIRPHPLEPKPFHTCPVSAFASHVRSRRTLDTAWAVAALHRSLAGKSDQSDLFSRLNTLENRLESAGVVPTTPELARELEAGLRSASETLTDRLLAQATGSSAGYMVLNPCSFTRRVAIELPDVTTVPSPAGPVKASQISDGKGQILLEIPPLGFAWFPREGGTSGKGGGKMRLADERCVRNEFFEAEIDPVTGGLKAIRDQRTRVGRLGQQLVYNPGSTPRVKQIRTTSSGPALGEIITEGELLDDGSQTVIATFRQRFRAWVSRPVLDMRIEIQPTRPLAGYPWHTYFGARFAWRDERTLLYRGLLGIPQLTTQTRPETPDFFELRWGQANVVVLTGGLPFHQRHGGRMLDVILVPPGETATTFDLAIGLDNRYPGQAALGFTTPVPVIPTRKGPPHIGASGWLFHLDAPNLMMTSLRPAPDGADAIQVRLLECAEHSLTAELRCARDPVRVSAIDLFGQPQSEMRSEGDAVHIDVMQTEMMQMQIDFS